MELPSLLPTPRRRVQTVDLGALVRTDTTRRSPLPLLVSGALVCLAPFLLSAASSNLPMAALCGIAGLIGLTSLSLEGWYRHRLRAYRLEEEVLQLRSQLERERRQRRHTLETPSLFPVLISSLPATPMTETRVEPVGGMGLEHVR